MPLPKRSASKSKEKIEEAPAPTSGVTVDIAERLLRADLANIVKKVRSGKPLTAQERRTLTNSASGEAPAPTDFVKNYVDLAEVLGVTRRTLQDWRKMKGAPVARSNGEHEVEAWRAFQRKIGGKGAPQPEDPESDKDLPSEPILKRRKLLLFCLEKEMQLAEKRGELVEISLVRETWSKKCAAANSLLRKRLENELPSELEGMEAAGIYEALVAVVDEFNEAMKAGGSVEGES